MNAPRRGSPDRPIADHPIPSGLYVHLPYCRSRCGYCAFVVSTDESSAAAYREALEREAAFLAGEARGVPFDSVYLGGGTPSLTPRAGPGGPARGHPPPFRRARLLGDHAGGQSRRRRPRRRRATGSRRESRASPSACNPSRTGSFRPSGDVTTPRAPRSALETLGRAGFALSGDLILGLPGADCRELPVEPGAALRVRRRPCLRLSAGSREVEDDRGRPAGPSRTISLRRRAGRRVAGDGGDARARGLFALRGFQLGAAGAGEPPQRQVLEEDADARPGSLRPRVLGRPPARQRVLPAALHRGDDRPAAVPSPWTIPSRTRRPRGSGSCSAFASPKESPAEELERCVRDSRRRDSSGGLRLVEGDSPSPRGRPRADPALGAGLSRLE